MYLSREALQKMLVDHDTIRFFTRIMDERHNALAPFGILILHGFSATLDSVKALYAPLKELGIPVAMPLLAGHGASSPEALRDSGWEEWLKDADQALQKLSIEADQIIVIGHSMGALLSLNLAVRYQGKVDSLVLAAPAIKLVSLFAPGRPLHFAAKLVSKIIRNWELKSLFFAPQCASCVPHYSWVPTAAIISFFELIKQTLPILSRVKAPVFVLQCRRESTVLPESATILCNKIGTEPSLKSILWLERSGHQIFCDADRETAVQAITDYVDGRIHRNGAFFHS